MLAQSSVRKEGAATAYKSSSLKAKSACKDRYTQVWQALCLYAARAAKGALILATKTALLLVYHMKPCSVPSQCPSSESP